MAPRPIRALMVAGLLAAGSAPSLAVPPSSGAASVGPVSAAASLEYLRQVMDQYHQAFGVYEDVSSAGNHFHSWAKIDDQNAAVTMAGSFTTSPHAGATAIRAEFQNVAGANYGGFYLLNGVLGANDTTPHPNFGEVPNAGFDLTGATSLTFWARGQAGGETIDFFMGGVGRNAATGQPFPASPYPDSTPVVKQRFVLTSQWTQYTLDLTGKNLSYVLGGFGWVASDTDNPGGAVFYLDDIAYQLSPATRAARLDQPRLLRSFTTEPFQSQPAPVGNFDFVLRNTAFLYDNALALLAFLADGSADSLRRARLIGDAFVYAAGHDRTYNDGRLRDSYAAGDLALPPGWTPNGRAGTVPIPGFYIDATQQFIEIGQEGLSTGNEAWAMIALLALHQRTGDARYLTTARNLAFFVINFEQTTGTYRGFRGGLNQPESASPTQRPWASTEHNLDLVAAFTLLARATGDAQWTVRSAHAAELVEAMWDSSIGCYRTGTTDPETRNETPGQLPLDVQAWSVLAVPDALAHHPSVLLCTENNHRTTAAGFSGFDFNEDKDGVWFEGTAQMAAAYERAGQPASALALRQTLAQAQSAPPTGDGFGLAASAGESLTTGFGTDRYFRRRHVGATAWNVFAQLVFNPFYGIPIRHGALFTVTPCRLFDTRQAADGPALASDSERLVTVVGRCGIPATATAVVVNLTVTGPTGTGHLTLFPGNLAAPVASTLNFSAGQTRANNAVLSLATDGAGTLRARPFITGGGTVHLLIDVSGYFE